MTAIAIASANVAVIPLWVPHPSSWSVRSWKIQGVAGNERFYEASILRPSSWRRKSIAQSLVSLTDLIYSHSPVLYAPLGSFSVTGHVERHGQREMDTTGPWTNALPYYRITDASTNMFSASSLPSYLPTHSSDPDSIWHLQNLIISFGWRHPGYENVGAEAFALVRVRGIWKKTEWWEDVKSFSVWTWNPPSKRLPLGSRTGYPQTTASKPEVRGPRDPGPLTSHLMDTQSFNCSLLLSTPPSP